MIKEVDRQTCRAVVSQAEKALQEALDSLGLSVSRGNAKFDTNSIEVKFTFTASQNGESLTKEELDYDKYAASYGITLSRGDEFNQNGKTFIVYGLKPNNRKYPVLARHNGKTYKMSTTALKWATA